MYFLRGKSKCKFLKLKSLSPAKIILIPNKVLQTVQVTLGNLCFLWKKEQKVITPTIQFMVNAIFYIPGIPTKTPPKFKEAYLTFNAYIWSTTS